MNIVQLLKDVMLDASFFLENVALRCRAVQIVSKCHNRRRRSEGGHANQEKFSGNFFQLNILMYKVDLCFVFLLIMEGVQSRLKQNSSFAFHNHLFGIPTIFKKNINNPNNIHMNLDETK